MRRVCRIGKIILVNSCCIGVHNEISALLTHFILKRVDTAPSIENLHRKGKCQVAQFCTCARFSQISNVMTLNYNAMNGVRCRCLKLDKSFCFVNVKQTRSLGAPCNNDQIHKSIPDICHFFYTGRIFQSQILHPKND